MQLSPSSLFLDPVRMSSPLVCDKNRLTAVACKKDFVIKQEKINKYKLTLLDCIKSDHSLKDRSALNLSAWTFDRLYLNPIVWIGIKAAQPELKTSNQA